MNRLKFLIVRVRTSARRQLTAIDVWVQDHHMGLGIATISLIGAGAWLLLRFRLDLVIELARQYAPVFTILSVVTGMVISSIGWIRKRRRARLATRDTTGS
ncbi:hypothetical protein [Streptomyces zaomyceticus]|uniref:hypothetical protein n=1 Tax=Streptomyces zaomyceticus TaxID=68286 RepID=UPI00339DB970